jgi:flagellar basal-body rod modification protein FlgD
MAISSINGLAPSVTAAQATTSATATAGSQTLAENFTQFLQLLTTQLQNQSPLDPLDTNQFTQQLVQFAQVEQQLRGNTQLEALVSIAQNSDKTSAIAFVGQRVVINGSTARLDAGGATWAFAVDKPATADVTITDKNGQVAYTGNFTVEPGTQVFTWDGKGNDGNVWPAGDYTISVVAKDASGQSVAISTGIRHVPARPTYGAPGPVWEENGTAKGLFFQPIRPDSTVSLRQILSGGL